MAVLIVVTVAIVVEGGATTVVAGVTVTVGAAVVAAAIRCPEASNSEELDPPQPATSGIRINKAFLTDILKLFIPELFIGAGEVHGDCASPIAGRTVKFDVHRCLHRAYEFGCVFVPDDVKEHCFLFLV